MFLLLGKNEVVQELEDFVRGRAVQPAGQYILLLVTMSLQGLVLVSNRIRHVKCDEEKPACRECRRTGRTCDGYGNRGGKRQADVPSMLYSKIYGVSSAAITNFHLSSLNSGAERRYYDYFQCKTRQQIYDTFEGSTRVHQLILQASFFNSSIKHTAIALGSLSEYLADFKTISQDRGQERQRLQYADTQYVKGISQLQKDMTATSQPPSEVVLISCLLLSLFDSLRGEATNGLVHLAAGIDILRRCFASELRMLTECDTNRYQSSPLIQDFAHIFSVMDLAAGIWLGRPCFYSLPMLYPETLVIPPFHLGSDSSLDDMSTSLNIQVTRAHVFHHAHAPIYDKPNAPIVPFHILAAKEKLLYELQQWPSFPNQYISASPSLTEDQAHRIAMMRMNYHSLLITISSFFSHHSTSLYHSLAPNFSQIIANAQLLLEKEPSVPNLDHLIRAVAANCEEPEPDNMSRFAFLAGAIQPLYLVAMRSQDRWVSEKAIALLEERPWREGLWDSAAMARLARKQIKGGDGERAA